MELVYQSNKVFKVGTQKAIVLLSGGMDSATCASLALSKGYEVLALSILYGQKHNVELKCSAAVARELDFSLYRLTLPPQTITGSALIDDDKELPTKRSLEEMKHSGVAPSYVPARNTVLLAIAASFAETMGAEVIYYGAHREDHVGYPDCRPEFVKAMSLAVMLGTAAKIRVEAPFIYETKSSVVLTADKLGTPLHLTHSCYQGKRPACGICDTCVIRINAFKEAGLIDPIQYEVAVDWGDRKTFSTFKTYN